MREDVHIEQKRHLIRSLILLVYLVAQIYFALHHEAWRDESQAWVLARNSSFAEILSLCASEGHPCLWFFILKFCQMLGVSFYALSGVSISIMTVCAALFLWKSPFSLFSAVCVLLSPLFFYYNPVICRVYAPLLLLIVLLCLYWPQRSSRPITYGVLTALLLQSHVLVAGLGIGCILERILYGKPRRDRKALIGMSLPIVSLVCMILELRQTGSTETFRHVSLSGILAQFDWRTALRNAASVGRQLAPSRFLSYILLVLWLGMAAAFCVALFRSRPFSKETWGHGIVSVCAFSVYFGVILFVRKAEHTQMACVFLMLLLFFLWARDSFQTEGETKPGKTGSRWLAGVSPMEALFVLSCLIMIPKSAWLDPMADVNGPYSGSLEAVRIIEENAPAEAVVALHNDSLSTTIVSYLYESEKRYLLWDIDNGCEYTIHKWGRPNRYSFAPGQLYEAIREQLPNAQAVYYVEGSRKLHSSASASEQMVPAGGNSVPNTWAEYYQIYRVD